MDKLIIRGACEHNLKNISLTLPKNKLIVFTGVSGSGKSSLAMDTIYAEGQRRYVESLSSYARQFLGVMKKPDVESIEGLSPAIAIDQKSVSHNPRSTVGTVTEIYDFLRLLYARIGHPHCPNCNAEISQQSVDQIVDGILEQKGRIIIFSPIIREKKGEFSSLLNTLKKQGFRKARVDGTVKDLDEDIFLIKTNKHSIDVLVDKVILEPKIKEADLNILKNRLAQSVEISLKLSNGFVISSQVKDASFEFPEYPQKMADTLFSELFACPSCNISLPELEPRLFSFNSPQGACSICQGLGTQLKINPKLIYNPNLSVLEGGIFPWAHTVENRESWTFRLLETVSQKHNIDLKKPLKSLDEKEVKILLYGLKEKVRLGGYNARFEGIIPNLERRYRETESDFIRNEIDKYMVKEPCPACHGNRLKKEALSVTIKGLNIVELTTMSIDEVFQWLRNLLLDQKLSNKEREIAKPILKETVSRLKFLLDVGLDYLSLDRCAGSLAGGEAQRIRLASQIGSGLSGVLYVLDEPSIGLHSRDHNKLIQTLKRLRDLGNTIIVVEHDAQTMLASDYVVDFGPLAGDLGGEIIAQGTPLQIMENPKSLTGQYLSGKKKVGQHLDNNSTFSKKEELVILGCTHNNLKNIDVSFPLGKFICVTGVSGSGKSSLVNETLLRQLRQEFGLKNNEKPGANKGILGIENINKIIDIDQSPIGRTPRSNSATYIKVFDEIRALYAATPLSKMRGYKAGRFSFNVKGGRCEVCQGEGQIRIEMQFLPDVYINCEACLGKRYNREVLEVSYKGKNIANILDFTVIEALRFFENFPAIQQKLLALRDVGLGYIKLGQPAPTLSGGEAQRVKLASELCKKQTGKTFYILDEPTTGLHFADLEHLLSVLKRLVNQGNTVIVIEHNLDIIKNADYIIDLGPKGGLKGGEIIFAGPLESLLKQDKSYTAQALIKE
ncbi:excinuclease ABC subunit UvrA [Patescibacteria group bacterium]|nr:excinuclease ABC subunit UvrA [Patescibacteria group bacterium]